MNKGRQIVAELLDAVARCDATAIRRASVKLSSVDPERRRFEIAKWCDEHPNEQRVIAWLAEQQKQKAAIELAHQEYTAPRPFRIFAR